MDHKVFFDVLRRHFKHFTKSQVAGIERLLAAWDIYGDGQREKLAYILATSKWETGGRMEPVRETFGKSTEDTIRKLDAAWRAGKLGQVSRPYWRNGWFGRGDVQLTHKENYEKFRDVVKENFGVDIVVDPDAVLRPEVSAFILIKGMMEGSFTGESLGSFINGKELRWDAARRVVNPKDRKSMVAITTSGKAFDAALVAAGYGSLEKETEMTKPENRRWGFLFWVMLGAIFLALAVFFGVPKAWSAEVVVEPDPTVGQELVNYAFAMLAAVATPFIGWVSWRLQKFLKERKIMTEAQANVLIGENLHRGTIAAISYAKSQVGENVSSEIDRVINQNAIVRVAASYLLPRYKETLERAGYSPTDLEDYIRARLGMPELPPIAGPTSSQTGALAGLIAGQVTDQLKNEIGSIFAPKRATSKK